MYYNVYGYDKMNSVPNRLGQQAEMIDAQEPDVLCVQEFDSKHRKYGKELLLQYGYEEVPVGDFGCVYPEGRNCEAIFYRTERLSLTESGGALFPLTVNVDGVEVLDNNEYTKSYTWAIFSERQSGKKVLVVNAHFMYNAPQLTASQAHAVRLSNATVVVNLVERIRHSKPAYANIPVVFGGDLNTQEGSDAYRALSARMCPAREAAEQFTALGYYGGYATYDAETREYHYKSLEEVDNSVAIDHAFVRNVRVLRYRPVTDFRALVTSDHLPWLLELAL